MIISGIEVNPAFADWPALEDLLREAYAPMEARINPPSFLTTMTLGNIAQKARDEDLFLARDGMRPVACGFGQPAGAFYEIGKVAVAQSHRNQGLARTMMDMASLRATALGLSGLQLYARVELTENHTVYRALGFIQTATFTHPGFTQPTAFIFQRPV